MAFIPLILHKKRKYRSESTIKYFLIQAATSIIILTSFIILNSINIEKIIIITLIIKIGRRPFHQWVLRIIEGLSWLNIILFFILQKINPFFIIMYLKTTTEIIYYFIVCNAVIGSIGGLNQTSLRKLITYSSIRNIRWLLTTLILDIPYRIYYYLIYRILMYATTFIFIKFEINDLNFLKKSNNIYVLRALNLLSLGGLPPLLGFLPKLIILCKLTNIKEYILIIALLTRTFISLFYYLRFFIRTILINPLKTNKKNKNYSLIITTINLFPVFLYPLFN